MADAPADLDAIVGRITEDLLAKSHMLAPDSVAAAVNEVAKPLGVLNARIYLSDVQQRRLVEVPPGTEALGVDSTIAGDSYRRLRINQSPADDVPGCCRLWIPLVDGTERLGVLELVVADASEDLLARYRSLASLIALILVSKNMCSDAYAQIRRRRDMALQAELVWAFLAPRTFATEQVLVSATLEPAYDVGGDAFDYSLLGDNLHLSIFDGAGHDLTAGLLASVAMASCRSTRRADGSLADIVRRADHAIARQFGHGRFVTALLCDLNIATGEFRWIQCGHPPPLLIRDNRVVKELDGRPELPLGLSDLASLPRPRGYPAPPPRPGGPVHTERLQPGDRLLLYTDGVTEGRAADGSRFGAGRLAEFIIRHGHAEMPAPEALRRLTRAVIEFQHGRLGDDATIMLVEWTPDRIAGQGTSIGRRAAEQGQTGQDGPPA
jgi:serine phosphatase RsbU (regulator of sigma subunit)